MKKTILFVSAILIMALVLTGCPGLMGKKVTSVNLGDDTLTLNMNDTHQLSATVLPITAENQNVTWSTNHAEIATVSDTGLVTAVAEGTAIITVTTEEGSFTDSVEITVQYVDVAEVTLADPGADVVYTGRSLQFSSEISPANATNPAITWSSSDSSLATVNDSGLVTGVAEGTVTIKAISADDSSIFAQKELIVYPYVEPTSLSLTVSDYYEYEDIPVGQLGSVSIAAEPAPEGYLIYGITDPTNVSVECSNTDVVEIIGLNYVFGYWEILFKGVTAGSADITVTSLDDDTLTDTMTVTVAADDSTSLDSLSFYPNDTVIIIEFEELMDPDDLVASSNYSITKDPDGTPSTVSFTVEDGTLPTDSYSVAILTLSGDFTAGDEIKVIVGTGIHDAEGNVPADAYEETLAYVPSLTCTIDATKFSDTIVYDTVTYDVDLPNRGGFLTSELTGAFNGVNFAGSIDGSHETETFIDSYMYYIVKKDTAVTSEHLLGSGMIESPGYIMGYTYDDLFSGNMVIMPNGEYDIYIFGMYDIDGDLSTYDDQWDSMSAKATFFIRNSAF